MEKPRCLLILIPRSSVAYLVRLELTHSLHLLITTSSHDNLEGNHLNCLKLDLITANVMILIKMVFSLLDVYVNVCMHMSSDVVFTVRAHEHKASHLKTSEHGAAFEVISCDADCH